jgi:sugar phosphate isomerase/epimerase
MSKIPISLQLYSIRDETAKDFAAAVSKVAQMGYSGVELAGYGNLDATGAQAAVKSAGLKVSGMHVSRDALRNDLKRTAAEATLFGTANVICPWLAPEEFSSLQAARAIGRELDDLGAQLRGYGLRLLFHNHATEFRVVENRAFFAAMLEVAAPQNLSAELDVYWAHVAGYAPERFLYEQGSRVRLLHLKDEKVLGSGPVNFVPVFTAAETIGAVEWYVVEQEQYDDTPMNSVEKCIQQLRKWGKA